MEPYAGIDVSLELSSVCVVDATGRIVREAKVASEPEALIAWLRGLGIDVTRVGLEAGPLSQWLHDGLAAAGHEVVLLETRHVKAALSAMTVKTDRKDARGIAQLLRMGWYRPVHRKSVPAQEVRALLAAPCVRRVVARLGPRNEGARVSENGSIWASVQGPHRRAAAAAGERGHRGGLARGGGQRRDIGALAGPGVGRAR